MELNAVHKRNLHSDLEEILRYWKEFFTEKNSLRPSCVKGRANFLDCLKRFHDFNLAMNPRDPYHVFH